MVKTENRENLNFLPQDIRSILNNDTFLSTIPICAVSPISDGVSHRVYAIESPGEKYFLKIRGDRFASIPSITCNPSDIAHEHRALTLFRKAAPLHFPRILSFNPESHYLVLSDVIKDGDKLDVSLARGSAPKDVYHTYGQVLSYLQRVTSDYTEPVRPEGDDAYYQTVLGHRLGYRNHPVLNQIIDELSRLPRRQLILADAAPKNMGVQNNGRLITFYDLETAHQGNPEFDYAYGAAHTLLHTLPHRKRMHEAIDQFTRGYGETPYNARLIFQLVLGLILYRLKSVVPYPIALNTQQKAKMETNLETRLPGITGKESWDEVTEQLKDI